ncbi:glycoside hydrolase family 3 N-terminal domain-containing protein [Pseudobutyrivibrio xylanivorans]|uniref:Fibronectin type III-like domain-containing protein n=1 Tax=Pseudobutyrivibrio xylanivorans TaxID=185007 RepID=A0A1G5RYE4_PSEXY|nr:glycoside hydrolase family 3 N-terminal domain-containing protein [Pseudobutyrivibrio xylanivorans]SCZ79165.1 Fibronectin type III-like domain-containing protein [Pseudobutyrivibrio xylanivorans]
MRTKVLVPAMRGVAALSASLLVLSTLGADVAETYRKNLDDVLGTTSYVTSTDVDSARFVSDYETVEDMAAAAKDIAIREGQEGTVIMKNDNDALPLSGTSEVALFGLAAYAPYPYNAGDFRGGNDDAVELLQAFEDAGVTVNSTVKDFYVNLMNKHEVVTQNMWTGADEYSIDFDYIYNTTVGDMVDFAITEVPANEFENLGLASDWKSKINKEDTTAICVFARPGGESNTYGAGTAVNYAGEKTGEDPLALSEDELSVIDAAKETCSKVVVLLNTGNAMLISDIAEGGAHEVDGIAYIGCINDYQCIGIVDVLTGKVNATGALTEAFVADNSSIPAVQNFGGDYYADAETLAANAENGYDERYPNVDITNTSAVGSFGGGDPTYSGGEYIVEAESIYVGYKYYETRYFDAIANPTFNAASAAGSTQGAGWNYGDEMVYSFGHGLSYLPYEQNIKSVEVENTVDGNVTAVVEVKNNGDADGNFLAQLYVSQPYTDYDKENLVEKSAIMFLNSAKVFVPAGETAEVTIEVPAKYLASYDYKNAKTYILDAGDYYFTAAAGAHEAVNNVLAAQGFTTADGMDADAKGTATVWNGNKELDTVTYSIENDVEVTNVADDADLNYWTGEDTVTYLSRQDWEGTYPINYNKDVQITLADSPKAEEWINLLKGKVYEIASDSPATEGEDKGIRFDATSIGYEQLENVNDEYWNELVSQITIDEAIGAVIHGGSQTDTLTNVDNLIVLQNEGVCGFSAAYTDEATGKVYHFNVNSQTLLGSSFNPQLAYEWGLVEGNSGLWLEKYQLWGTGLTLKRTPYNGRNYEYISEDPMLTNRIGYGTLKGCTEKGILNGPKHLGFNDQEHTRNGIAVYLNEQKLRETDLRGFQGGLEDAKGLAVMIAFNRLGPTNASAYAPLITNILRQEWAFTGVISTDMVNNIYYFTPEGSVMAGITQMADFATNDNHINLGEGGVDGSWGYLSVDAVKNDSALVEKARENLKYQLYTFANSALMNVSTEKVEVWWDTVLNTIKLASGILLVVSALLWLVFSVKPSKSKEEN